jgi:hypothetical protein
MTVTMKSRRQPERGFRTAPMVIAIIALFSSCYYRGCGCDRRGYGEHDRGHERDRRDHDRR